MLGEVDAVCRTAIGEARVQLPHAVVDGGSLRVHGATLIDPRTGNTQFGNGTTAIAVKRMSRCNVHMDGTRGGSVDLTVEKELDECQVTIGETDSSSLVNVHSGMCTSSQISTKSEMETLLSFKAIVLSTVTANSLGGGSARMMCDGTVAHSSVHLLSSLGYGSAALQCSTLHRSTVNLSAPYEGQLHVYSDVDHCTVTVLAPRSLLEVGGSVGAGNYDCMSTDAPGMAHIEVGGDVVGADRTRLSTLVAHDGARETAAIRVSGTVTGSNKTLQASSIGSGQVSIELGSPPAPQQSNTYTPNFQIV